MVGECRRSEGGDGAVCFELEATVGTVLADDKIRGKAAGVGDNVDEGCVAFTFFFFLTGSGFGSWTRATHIQVLEADQYGQILRPSSEHSRVRSFPYGILKEPTPNKVPTDLEVRFTDEIADSMDIRTKSNDAVRQIVDKVVERAIDMNAPKHVIDSFIWNVALSGDNASGEWDIDQSVTESDKSVDKINTFRDYLRSVVHGSMVGKEFYKCVIKNTIFAALEEHRENNSALTNDDEEFPVLKHPDNMLQALEDSERSPSPSATPVRPVFNTTRASSTFSTIQA
ncbi:uncharacterized protein LY89DRAFT_715503 [Mollisia scopiformis]|uniref:Uncharacterized protein n=1 Tax=Mollisia scopiformis TaxID=149040 RepID=A0A194XME6_MOLSC|nr:uncharacterized protein LY89DRAFT_715503 [Mollisia scopiformis]KUJ21264.1 hypothetical protein LY89DRAFT_715503 [Mollisia scopiformis]